MFTTAFKVNWWPCTVFESLEEKLLSSNKKWRTTMHSSIFQNLEEGQNFCPRVNIVISLKRICPLHLKTLPFQYTGMISIILSFTNFDLVIYIITRSFWKSIKENEKNCNSCLIERKTAWKMKLNIIITIKQNLIKKNESK